tara:strand:- start:1013 stop:1951 length:939 start_codon:yes stop_codon:yes gene_type:complete
MPDETTAISLMDRNMASYRSYSCEAMATIFSFHLSTKSSDLLDSAVMEAEELLANLESQLSLYIENSDTTRINRAHQGEEITVSQTMVDCLLAAFDASQRLGGAFDPFLGQLAIDAKRQRPILSHLKDIEFVDCGSSDPVISLDPDSSRVKKLRMGPLLDLGGIGKGFALDCLKTLFQNWDIESGLLDSGGSTLLALDRNEDIAEWALNIGYNSCVKSIVLVPGSAIASSGELFQGSHIIEPAEGGQSAWKRSYAMAGTGSLADAASTAGLVLGDREIESICEQEDDLSFAVFSEETGHGYGSFFNTEICGT